jgi:hypothetical protein
MANKNNAKPTKGKTSSVRHTRAIALDRSKRPATLPPPQQVEQLLAEIVQPATFNLLGYYQQAGLRARILTLPVMLAFVLSLIWRQLGSVSEAVRVLQQEGLLWPPPLQVTQQAVSSRLRSLPAALFEALLDEILPVMQQGCQARSRPLPAQLQGPLSRFNRIVAVDGSSLDALVKKVGLLRQPEGSVLGGKMVALLDLASQLPCKIWYGEESQAHDQKWWEQIEKQLEKESLVLFEVGFVNYERYRQLSAAHKYFVTRVKSNMAYEKLKVLREGAKVREWLVRVGQAEEGTAQTLRLVEVA